MRYDHEVTEVQGNELVCSNGTRVPFDECVWCTQAGAARWLRDTGLELDDGGFIKVRVLVWQHVTNEVGFSSCILTTLYKLTMF